MPVLIFLFWGSAAGSLVHFNVPFCLLPAVLPQLTVGTQITFTYSASWAAIKMDLGKKKVPKLRAERLSPQVRTITRFAGKPE